MPLGGKVKQYCQFTRAHTVPLEAVPALVGALLATRGQLEIAVVVWLLYGVMYHLTGYGMNSYTDYILGHDDTDPNKQHHPLNTGGMSVEEGFWIMLSLIISTATLAVFAATIGEALAITLGIVVIGVVAGFAYNLTSKSTELKPISISIAHSTVFLAPYVSIYGSIDYIAVAGFVMMMLWVLFQIGISGELKDIETDEVNILRDRLGYEVIEDDFTRLDGKVSILAPSAAVKVVIPSFRFIITVCFTAIAISVSGVIVSIAVLSAGFVSIYESNRMIAVAGDRMDRIQSMSAIEILTLIMFTLSFSGVVGLDTAMLIIIASAMWVIPMNRLLWGTWVAPDV